MTTRPLVIAERLGAVATITINRPDRRNALTTEVKVALRDELKAVADDSTVRAVVLTGAGGHFCAGQDLSEHAGILKETPDHAFDTVEQHYSPIVTALATMPKPAIAAVEGTCVGAGLGFALACDLRVVSSDAKFGTAFSSIGLTCDSGLAHTRPQAVGTARARELILLAEPFSGVDADRFGLVTEQSVPGAALEVAVRLAERLAAGPTFAYAQSKQLLADWHTRTFTQSLDEESRAQSAAGATADHRGAVASFLSKQAPRFNGS